MRFLLDVSYVRIAARHLGVNSFEYNEALPVQQLRKIHFTGIHNRDGYLMDHLPILEIDWPWLDWVIENTKGGEWGDPHLLAFEYGGTGNFF